MNYEDVMVRKRSYYLPENTLMAMMVVLHPDNYGLFLQELITMVASFMMTLYLYEIIKLLSLNLHPM